MISQENEYIEEFLANHFTTKFMSCPQLAGQCSRRNRHVIWYKGEMVIINTEIYFYAGGHVQGKAEMHGLPPQLGYSNGSLSPNAVRGQTDQKNLVEKTSDF